MTTATTEPIERHWIPEGLDGPNEPSASASTAEAVNSHLARMEVADIGPQLVPYLAAAAAELALLAGIPWRFGADDPPVALLRLIAKVTLRDPRAGGPHTARLLDLLRCA